MCMKEKKTCGKTSVIFKLPPSDSVKLKYLKTVKSGENYLLWTLQMGNEHSMEIILKAH